VAGSPLLSYLLPQHRQLQRRIYPDLCLAQNHCGRVGNPLQNCFYTVRRAAVRPIFRNYQLRPLATLLPRVFWAAKPAFNRVFGLFRPPCEDGATAHTNLCLRPAMCAFWRAGQLALSGRRLLTRSGIPMGRLMLIAVIDLTKVVLRLRPVTFVPLTCLTGRLTNQSGRSWPPKPRGSASKFGQVQQIRTAPPQVGKISMLMLNTRFWRCA